MKYAVQFARRPFLLAVALIFTLSVTASRAASPRADAALDEHHPSVRAVMALQGDITPEVMQWPSVLGTAVGLDEAGGLSLVIYVDQDGANRGDVIRAFPPSLRGINVTIELTDKFVSMVGGKPSAGAAPAGPSHKAIQTTPIQLGTSGGWRHDLANGYCCGGTLGSLVKIGATQYILSNYHVLEADIVNGGNSRVATAGDPVVQPGLIDVGCTAGNAQNVATLSGIKSLPGSNVDAAIAQVVSGMVRTNGSILEIGTISASTVGASLSQLVKKSGRTTGLSRSKVTGLNASVSITYENECAGGTAFTKVFTGQIVIANKGSKFIAGGDSGSLMVEDTGTNPRAIGLLFAGSSFSAIANPIGEVLSFLGATMVGVGP